MKIADKLSEKVENTVRKEKLVVTSNFSFFYSVLKRLELQTRKNKDLFGKYQKETRKRGAEDHQNNFDIAIASFHRRILRFSRTTANEC